MVPQAKGGRNNKFIFFKFKHRSIKRIPKQEKNIFEICTNCFIGLYEDSVFVREIYTACIVCQFIKSKENIYQCHKNIFECIF